MKFIECNATNFRRGRNGTAIKYIVVHYTANNGDTAEGNLRYFSSATNLKASAHYFVDEKEVAQSVSDTDTAWHCGGGLQGGGGATHYQKCDNSNSIGIELCSRKNAAGNYYFMDKTLENAIEFIKTLMNKYGIDRAHVIRHYDVTGKNCPAPLIAGNSWSAFLNRLNVPIAPPKEEEEDGMIYNWIDENMPKWAIPTVEKLYNKGIIKGNEKGELGLNDTMLRMLVIHDRVGLYDKV